MIAHAPAENGEKHGNLMTIITSALPVWIQRLIIGTVITLSLTGGFAWLTHVANETVINSKDIIAVKTEQSGFHNDFRRLEDKIDALDTYLREHPNYSPPRTQVIYRDRPVTRATREDVLDGLSPAPQKPVAQH